ncbi:MAG: HD-GYP domain-containing protein [Acidobacteria bacterium]|nr:HD-GYP domain-containing protein [Acidobacteriota bacterium]
MTAEDPRPLDDLVKRLVAAIRANALYSPTHPIVNRSVGGLLAAFEEQFRSRPTLSIGFFGSDVVVGGTRLKGSAGSAGLVRHFRERQVGKLTFSKDMGQEGLRTFVGVIADRDTRPLSERLAGTPITGVSVGTISTDDQTPDIMDVGAARQVYGVAVAAADALWGSAVAGDEPDPNAAHLIIDALATSMTQDRTLMLALTELKGHDEYTFTHMVNVSLLTMAQARTLGIEGQLLREFGLAGLMHDIGKVKTPREILNKPEQLTPEEFSIMRRHVVDGAQILRHIPEMSPLAPIVAFEHHLRQDLSGYPENVGARTLNLCTMLVSIADVFDALRTKRIYRDGLPAARVRRMLAEESGQAFEPTLLRRFISLVGIFPVGTCVRLKTGELGIVTAEHATDAFRPIVRILIDSHNDRVDRPWIVDTADRDDQGRHPYSVLEAVDAKSLGLDAPSQVPA